MDETPSLLPAQRLSIVGRFREVVGDDPDRGLMRATFKIEPNDVNMQTSITSGRVRDLLAAAGIPADAIKVGSVPFSDDRAQEGVVISKAHHKDFGDWVTAQARAGTKRLPPAPPAEGRSA